ncbi:MAG: glutathione-disulfide reductase [Alphaproteobacteria bacterium]
MSAERRGKAVYDFDFFVIGGGSGGVRAARIAANHGARVAVAEERYLGGTCVNVGCVPKKLLVYAAHFAEDFEDAAGFGWEVGERRFDWARLIANKDAEIARLNGIYRRMLEGSGVEIIEGHARLADRHTVTIDARRCTAQYVLIATGGWPAVPDIPGAEHAITSNEAFHLDRLPERVAIIGGGYIAVEFAGIFHGLGAEVVQLYRGPLFLRGFDDDVRATLAEEMAKKGIDLRFNANVARIDKADGMLRATLDDGAAIEAERVMYATGRAPLSRDLGLEEAGVALNPKGAVVVDDYSRSSVENIFAVGDITDRVNLTPVAIREGHAVAETLFNDAPTRPDHENVPSAVFSQPAIGAVGLTEAAACARYGAVDVYKSTFKPMKHTLSGRDERTMMKLIVDRASDRVVGVHMVGPEAGEIIQGIAIAVKCGATKAQFDATVGIHPTLAEEFVTMREKAPDPLPEGRDCVPA